MTKYCKGCGAKLQNDDKDAIGYVPTLDASYCERCFRIRHYGDVTISIKKKIESNVCILHGFKKIMSRINEKRILEFSTILKK